MSDKKSDLVAIGGLWLNTSDSGTKYMSGYLGEAKLLIFKNENKSSDKAPDYRMMIAKGKRQTEYENGEGSPQNSKGGASGDTDF